MNPPAPSSFKVYSNASNAPETVNGLKPGGEATDRELASGLLKSLNNLQEAMDAAALAGLIVEPSFRKYSNRFRELGNDCESYVAKIEIYRKLA